MYLGRIGLGYELPPPALPPAGSLVPSPTPALYASGPSALAVQPPRTYTAATIAVTPAPGAGGLSVTQQVSDQNFFGSGARGGSSRSGGSTGSSATVDELVENETADAIDQASTADGADTMIIDGSGRTWLPEELAQEAQTFWGKHKTPIIVGGVLVVGGLVLWRILG